VAYAITVVDTDTPNGGFTHWMLANEPANLREPTPGTGVSGKNDFGQEGYGGPCPPRGSTHHYAVTVYALDAKLPLNLLYSAAEFRRALAGHVLTQTSLTATYSR
jgi:Raf kinase inhibitor-like YbhB/YbcL family protein